VLVLNDHGGNNVDTRYFDPKITQYRSFDRHKVRFAAATFHEALKASVVILGHVNYTPLAVALRLLRPNLKMLLNVYGVDVWKKLPKFQLLGVRRMDHIFSISTATRDQMIFHNKLTGKRYHILPCTLDPYYGRDAVPISRKELSLSSGKMILSVARLDLPERQKGIDTVIMSMPAVIKEVTDAFYVVVGEGPDRQRLERIAKEVGVHEKVIFAGRVSDNSLPAYYKASDVFVLPSLKEGFGIVLLEAMFYAKPCIGPRAGGIPEVIEDGKTGFLAARNDNQALADHIIRLLNNVAIRRAMGEAGKDRLNREFSFGLFRERLEKVLCQ
jgi:phosphatidyl-myo-inositol dimannoside synthase